MLMDCLLMVKGGSAITVLMPIEEPGNSPNWLRVYLDYLTATGTAELKLPHSRKESGEWETA
jgi:hypothetical protein